jgi:hypothetical protein
MSHARGHVEAEVDELRRRGVMFEDEGKPGRAERGAWFGNSEGNMLGIGQAIA